MEIRGDRIVLRKWTPADRSSMLAHADNRNVWRNLKDRFPHPYSERDAIEWIRHVEALGDPATEFAIVVDGAAVGGIGIRRGTDVDRKTGEIGYWLGEPFWGRGFATEALRAVAAYAFETLDLERLEAGVFEWNPASCRVLEKAGFHLEARLEKSVFKDGRLIDRLLYARLRS